jgi:hypothetical protein
MFNLTTVLVTGALLVLASVFMLFVAIHNGVHVILALSHRD